MNNKALTLSIIAACFAVFFVQSYVTSIEDDWKKKFGTSVLAVVASRDIKEMQTIDETMLEFKVFPKTFLEPASISVDKKEEDKDSAKILKNIAGMLAVVPLKRGEQLTYNKITEASIRTGLAPQVTPKKRAVAIPVNETSGVSKLVKPGDRVDLIAVIDIGSGKESKVAKTILQDVMVLSIGRYVTNNLPRTIEVDNLGGKERIHSLAEDFSFSSVTLEVEPMQAQTIALLLASSDSALTISLRNNDDVERINLNGTIFSEVLGSDISRLKVKK